MIRERSDARADHGTLPGTSAERRAAAKRESRARFEALAARRDAESAARK